MYNAHYTLLNPAISNLKTFTSTQQYCKLKYTIEQ